MNLQLKNVPAEIHDELRRRAERRGVTQRDYVLELIRRDQEVPTVEDWLERMRDRPPVNLPPGATLAALDAARQEREDELYERHRRVSGR